MKAPIDASGSNVCMNYAKACSVGNVAAFDLAPCVTFPIGTRGLGGRSFLFGLPSLLCSDLFLQGTFVLQPEIIVLKTIGSCKSNVRQAFFIK